MSDQGFEPPAATPPAQAPPPPPPNLAPPPGYTAYAAGPASAAPLKRVGGLRTAMLVLLGVFAVGTIIRIAQVPGTVDSAEDFLAGAIPEDQFRDDVDTYNLSGALPGAAQLALAVLTVIWLFRIIKNHRSVGRRVTWAPGWAIGGWFLPPILFVIPTLVLRESWKAADPDVSPGDERWKASPDTPLLWAWVALFVVAPIIFAVAGLRQQVGMMSNDADDMAESFDGRLGLLLAEGIVLLLAAAAWALLVRALSERHMRLTRESTAR